MCEEKGNKAAKTLKAYTLTEKQKRVGMNKELYEIWKLGAT